MILLSLITKTNQQTNMFEIGKIMHFDLNLASGFFHQTMTASTLLFVQMR